MLSETEDKTETIQIESLGGINDIALKVSFVGYKTRLRATISSGFENINGPIQYDQESDDGKPALVLSLTQEPVFPPFFNYYALPEELSKEARDQIAKEHQELVDKEFSLKPQVQYLSLRENILGDVIKKEYQEQAYNAVVSGQVKLILVVQSARNEDPDFSLKRIMFNTQTLRSGGILHSSGK
ncbi:hypothetical protein D3C87_1306250 [compost metagenome]